MAGNRVELVGQSARRRCPLQGLQALAQGQGNGCRLGLAGQGDDSLGEAFGLCVTYVERHETHQCCYRWGSVDLCAAGLHICIGALARARGSEPFARATTPALVFIALEMKQDSQIIDALEGVASG